MLRRLSLFEPQAYPAPDNPVIEPPASTRAMPARDAKRAERAGRAGRGASARALDLEASMQDKGVLIPVLMASYPHVVDRIASAWSDPVRLARVFNSLLVDERGSRQGFPVAAVEELLALHRASQGETSKPVIVPESRR